MRRCERGGGGGVGDVDRKSVSVNFMIVGERVLDSCLLGRGSEIQWFWLRWFWLSGKGRCAHMKCTLSAVFGFAQSWIDGSGCTRKLSLFDCW